MISLLGLFELLRITEQHDTASALRSRENISERHLTRLVDKEHIDRRQRVWSRPKPLCSAKNVNLPVIESGDGFTVISDLLDLRWRIAFGRDLMGAVCL